VHRKGFQPQCCGRGSLRRRCRRAAPYSRTRPVCPAGPCGLGGHRHHAGLLGVCVPRWLPTQGNRSRCGATHPVIAMSVSSRERRIPADPGVQDRLVRSYRPRTDRGQHRSTPGRRLPPARHPGGRGRAHQPDSAEQYRHRIRTTDHARSPPPTINRRHERRHLRTQPTARRGVERPQDVHRSTAHVAGIVECWAAPTLELRN